METTIICIRDFISTSGQRGNYWKKCAKKKISVHVKPYPQLNNHLKTEKQKYIDNQKYGLSLSDYDYKNSAEHFCRKENWTSNKGVDC